MKIEDEEVETIDREIYNVMLRHTMHMDYFEENLDQYDCSCGMNFLSVQAWTAHVAEQIAARLKELG